MINTPATLTPADLLRVCGVVARAGAGAAAIPIVGNNPVRPSAMQRRDLLLELLHRRHGAVYEKNGPLPRGGRLGFRV
jgi:hypothetical protein